MYRIEPLDRKDIDKCTAALIEYAQELGEPYNENYIRESLSAVADRKLSILVAKNDQDEIVGVSAFIVTPHLYTPEVFEAREFIWHTSPKLNNFARARLQRNLLDIMMETCRRKKIDLYVGVLPGSSLADMLELRAFEPKAIQHKKEFR